MKNFLFAILATLICSLGYSQVIGYRYTVKLGPANNQISVYAKPNGSGTVKWQQLNVVVGFKTSSAQPGQGTFAPNNSLFGSYGAVTPSASQSTDGTYTYTNWGTNLGSPSSSLDVTSGQEYLVGTITYPAALDSYVPYLLDLGDGGVNGFGDTFIVEGTTNNYFYAADGTGNSSFYEASGGGYKDGGSTVTSSGPDVWATTPTPKVLPLKLLSFTATAQSAKTNTALLDWTVAEQVNTSSFEVERSTNGVGYSKIGTVAAAGNYAGKQTYSFTDANAATATNYYRLKMVDVDGKFTYSPVKTVVFDGKATENVFLSPNPTRGEFHVKGLTATAIVRVLDINGKVLQTYNGVNAFTTLNISQLPSGVYLAQVIEEGKFGGTFKLVKE